MGYFKNISIVENAWEKEPDQLEIKGICNECHFKFGKGHGKQTFKVPQGTSRPIPADAWKCPQGHTYIKPRR